MKRMVVAFAGGSLLLLGAAMVVLPGPGLPVVAGALALLGREFPWASRALRCLSGFMRRRKKISPTAITPRNAQGTPP